MDDCTSAWPLSAHHHLRPPAIFHSLFLGLLAYEDVCERKEERVECCLQRDVHVVPLVVMAIVVLQDIVPIDTLAIDEQYAVSSSQQSAVGSQQSVVSSQQSAVSSQ